MYYDIRGLVVFQATQASGCGVVVDGTPENCRPRPRGGQPKKSKQRPYEPVSTNRDDVINPERYKDGDGDIYDRNVPM